MVSGLGFCCFSILYFLLLLNWTLVHVSVHAGYFLHGQSFNLDPVLIVGKYEYNAGANSQKVFVLGMSLIWTRKVQKTWENNRKK